MPADAAFVFELEELIVIRMQLAQVCDHKTNRSNCQFRKRAFSELSKRLVNARPYWIHAKRRWILPRQLPKHVWQDAAVAVVVDFDGGIDAAVDGHFAGFAILGDAEG